VEFSICVISPESLLPNGLGVSIFTSKVPREYCSQENCQLFGRADWVFYFSSFVVCKLGVPVSKSLKDCQKGDLVKCEHHVKYATCKIYIYIFQPSELGF